MTHNGLQLLEGGDFGALYCQPSTNFDRSTKLDLTTEPPLLGRCCVRSAYAERTCRTVFAQPNMQILWVTTKQASALRFSRGCKSLMR